MTATVESILEQVRQLSPGEQARVRSALNEEPVQPRIPYAIIDLLKDKTIDDIVIKPRVSAEETIETLQAWRTRDDAPDDEGGETWADMLRSLDENRFSERKLFPEAEPQPIKEAA